MMKRLFIFACILMMSSTLPLVAQNHRNQQPLLPLNPSDSPLFGKDIVINDQPGQNQQGLTICSAFNGWMYSCYWYRKDGRCNITVMKSTDMGMTWELFKSFPYGFPDQRVARIDIKACGDTLPDLKLFIGALLCDSNSFEGDAFVTRYNGLTGDPEAEVLNYYSNYIRDFCIATDMGIPSPDSNPNSIAIIFSDAVWGHDTIICRTSVDGGYTFQNRGVGHSTQVIADVDLAYGSSTSFNAGRYFATWEGKVNLNATLGHIYTAHSEPGISGQFTTPVCLDNLDPDNTNKCRNPAISCQYGLMDNDSSNLTSILVFEKYDQSSGNFDIKGYFNKQSTLTQYFQPFSFTNTFHNNIQPDIAYNPYDSNFAATYYDKTEYRLPFLTQKLNFENPQSWTPITLGYNDVPVLNIPFPRVIVNNENRSDANVWIGDGTGGNGAAMFDAQYSTYTSTDDKQGTMKTIKTYPNPCSSSLSFEFELESGDEIKITMFSMIGQPVGEHIIKVNSPGRHVVKVDLSSFKGGCYLYRFSCEEYSSFGKVIVRK